MIHFYLALVLMTTGAFGLQCDVGKTVHGIPVMCGINLPGYVLKPNQDTITCSGQNRDGSEFCLESDCCEASCAVGGSTGRKGIRYACSQSGNILKQNQKTIGCSNGVCNDEICCEDNQCGNGNVDGKGATPYGCTSAVDITKINNQCNGVCTDNLCCKVNCEYNTVIAGNTVNCACVTSGGSNDLKEADKYCKKKTNEQQITYSIETKPSKVCDAITKVAAGASCKFINSNDVGTVICIEDEYKPVNGGSCVTFPDPNNECTKNPACLTCSDTILTGCGTCNPGYHHVSEITCTEWACTTGASGKGCKECVAVASRTVENHCATCNDGYTIVSGSTVCTETSSALSMGIQTVLLASIFHFM